MHVQSARSSAEALAGPGLTPESACADRARPPDLLVPHILKKNWSIPKENRSVNWHAPTMGTGSFSDGSLPNGVSWTVNRREVVSSLRIPKSLEKIA